MKKLLALSLALAMALSMGAVALAADEQVDPQGYRLTDGVVDAGKKVTDNITPGWTVYYQLVNNEGSGLVGMDESDEVKGATIKQSWDLGKEHVESVTIVKKKYSGDNKYYYWLEVKFKVSTSTSISDVIGEITVRKNTTTKDGSTITGEPFEITLEIGYTYGFPNATTIDDIAAESTKLYNFGTSGAGHLDLDGDQTFTFASGDYFDVDLTGQGKLLLYYDTKYNASVSAKYPEANLDFISYNGASFNKTGELTILADPDSYLYELKTDGSLVRAKADYDEYEEAFKLKTRTLGRYVISDTMLKITAPAASSSSTPSSSTVPTTKPNPSTGAAA